ncbi:hypothetical protein EW145_g2561 [Phellinidium pouzarii]|uniref:Mediator of RNA polymerase II transcription subunit 17 n=1 Tax=Phellinidium pouzarii TaxID=167371 RepID=A0A4S4LAV5_9AGAM|nr:hypothetical protein EW145_g2561 [Phellinidium pouzarii]
MQEPHVEPAWRKIKLSLERPYKDDNGQPTPTLLDITQDGQFIYEPREETDAKLGQRFRRIFAERGIDFFDSDSTSRFDQNGDKSSPGRDGGGVDVGAAGADEQVIDGEAKLMTPEMLFKMRSEILPRLHIALGEMSHARDLLSLLLSASAPVLSPTGAPGLLSLSAVPAAPLHPTLPPGPFNGFDRNAPSTYLASDVLHIAAVGIERSTSRSELFWADALRIRRTNWGLIPAPLPLGASTGKGADKTSRDFLVSYGLEQSPPLFRRTAIVHLAFHAMPSSTDEPLVFPHRDRTRLRVTLTRKDLFGVASTCHSHVETCSGDTLHSAIKDAQKEVVEKEIFEELIKEASNLPTASARVSERLIVIDAAHNVELRFELIDESLITSSNTTGSSSDTAGYALCDLIASALPVFLLRQHAHAKSVRLGIVPSRGSTNATQYTSLAQFRTQMPQILTPIIDLLQYNVFLTRVRDELSRAVKKLRTAGVRVVLRFEGVGETGKVVVDELTEGKEKVCGEAMLRIDESIRFTFASPSSLTAHLPHATIAVVSIPQLTQLLADETERNLLGRICEFGVEACQSLSGTWFVDEMMCRAVGRWEGCVLNFRIRCSADFTLDCHVHQLIRLRPRGPAHPLVHPRQYSPPSMSMQSSTLLTYGTRDDTTLDLFAWVRHVIEATLAINY